MNIRKQPPTSCAFTAFALSIALMFPCVVEAVSIGEVVLQSRLGEPLLAQIDLTAGSGEHIEEACLSLSVPPPGEDDSSIYLTKANLTLKAEGKRQYVVISSRKLFNDAFAKLRLQVKCPGTGSVIKTLTILPDLEASAPQTQIAAPAAPAEIENTSAHTPADTHDIAPAANQRDTRSTIPEARKHPSDKAAHPVSKRRPPQTASRKPDRPAAFRLKLSGEPIDESRIGKVSAEERSALRAQQKLLDADDQMASFLALQHQVKQLQDELGEIKLQLAQLGAAPSSVSGVASPVSSPSIASQTTATTVTQPSPKPAVSVKQPVEQQDGLSLRNGLLAALGLVSIILALWQGLRYYTKVKTRLKIKPQQGTAPIPKPAANVAEPPKAALSSAVKAYSPAKNDLVPAIVVPPMAKAAKDEAGSPPPQKIEEEVSEEDSMLEEAGLYAAHGRPAKAVEILQEVVKRCPSKAEAWPLLLSIYSSLGKTSEFEKTAREFLRHHKDSPAWSGIQALGRTLDQNNPLYADNSNRISDVPLLPDTPDSRRPIGDVLMEMGLLSKQDLQNCLDDFDPKKHGRFGGYLVARKAITLAQLDQALLQQQGVNIDARPGPLPSRQDMENFLADFDPKRDGSVGEFLASRQAATPERLSQLLQQPASDEAAAPQPQADEPLPLGKGTTLDFVLESTSKLPVFDLEFEPATEKNKPLDFEVEPSSPSPEISLAFPELDLDMGSNNPPDKK